MKNHTHIAVVLDRSGSMESMKREIIGGFNNFLEEQKEVPGTATLTLVQFDDQIDRLSDNKPLKDIKPLNNETYVPRGCTKLYDAIGLTVNSVNRSNGKNDKVLIVILTDGLENSSQEYTTETIRQLIEDRQKDGWEFTFIGANQDAILTARGIGMTNAASNLTYAATPKGAQNMFASLSNATATFRCSAHGTHLAYNKRDREQQEVDPATLHGNIGLSVRAEDGYKAGKMGGIARSESLTQRQRSSISRNAAKARWSKHSV